MKRLKQLFSCILIICVLSVSVTACGNNTGDGRRFLSDAKTIVTDTKGEEKVSLPKPSPEPVLPDESEAGNDNEDEREGERSPNIPAVLPYYTLSDEDIAKFDEQLTLCRELSLAGVEYAVLETELDALDEMTEYIQNQAYLAEVLYYCDMSDEELVNNYLTSAEYSGQVSDSYFAFISDLYYSEVPEYQEYFADCTEMEIKYLLSRANETAELELRNTEIQTQYHELGSTEFEEEIAGLYSEFVVNSNEIARKCGYENYYDYASEFSYVRDYGKEERERFREYVKEYIVPIYNVSYIQYEDAMEDLSRQDKKLLRNLLMDRYDSLPEDYLGGYIGSLTPETEAGMQHMFENGNYFLTDNKNAYAGAFTIMLEKPFCFFGPGYQSLFTMIHEMGHYCAEVYMDTDWLSYDLGEVQSQGNELLLLRYLENELPENIYRALAWYEIYYFTDTIVYATIMDEFEEIVYGSLDVTGYSTEDFDKIMYDLLIDYGMDDSDGYAVSTVEWMWRNVGIDYQIYYLSYAVSAMASLNLYSESVADYEKAVESYQKIQEEAVLEKGFIGALEYAGIMSVFEEDAYIKLMDTFYE